MPAYEHEDQSPYRSLKVHFQSQADLDDFSNRIGQEISHRAKWIWHPKQVRNDFTSHEYRGSANPRYPIYIVSKGRWERSLTARALDAMNVPYRIVVEPQEYEHYAAVINESKILTLPFGDLGQGSIPARNWIWEHSISEGHNRHWILDDNIYSFHRFHKNTKYPMGDGTAFAIMEDFVERYKNVPMAGPNYEGLVYTKRSAPPIRVNTRVYSCILLSNHINLRWRGKYNEDTDLALRMLKAGYCTILFQAFTANKVTTMTMRGGNTDDLYLHHDQFDGRLEMAKSLQRQHPDVTEIRRKWGRYQHHVDYSRFKSNNLIKRKDIEIPEGINEYGMQLVEVDNHG